MRPLTARRAMCVFALGTAIVATATVPAQGQEVTETVHEDAVAAVVDRIAPLVEGPDRGFAGMAVTQGGLDLFWRHQPPADVGQVITEAARDGVTVSVRAAQYSRDALREARSAILADAERAANAGIVTAAVLSDGSGLRIEVDGSFERAKSIPAVAESTVPITFAEGVAPDPLSRWLDLSPFSGGAAIKDNTLVFCSTAFGMHRRSNRERLLLTAAHCIKNTGDTWSQGNGGLVVGSAFQRYIPFDAATLRPVSAFTSSGPNVYTQLTDTTGVGTGEVKRRITGRSSVAKDQFVCTNGAFSGQVCSIRITDVDITYLLPFRDGYSYFVTGHRGKRDDGGMVGGEGDSGGPVMRFESTGARALGVFSGGGTVVRCSVNQTTTFIGTRRCFAQLYYTDINRIVQELDLEVNTD